MEFKDWLKDILDSKNIKPSELSHRSGVSDAEISRLLSGKRKPSAKTIKKIIPFLHTNEEESFRAAGLLAPEKEAPKIIEIPIRGECPAGRFNFAFEDILDTVVLNYDYIKDRNCFALRVKGDCLRDLGIFNKDIVIISPHAHIDNGDIVIARVGDECTMKKFYKTENQIILQPCNHDYEPIIINPKEKHVEIIGKVIRALKSF